MPRAKRKSRIERPEPLPEREITEGLQVGETLAALCWLCGRTISDRAVKIDGLSTGERIPYFESIEWQVDKPFGVAYRAAGRGSFSQWRYITPEEAPELFQQLKARFLQALKELLDKGWLTSAEVAPLLVGYAEVL